MSLVEQFQLLNRRLASVHLVKREPQGNTPKCSGPSVYAVIAR